MTTYLGCRYVGKRSGQRTAADACKVIVQENGTTAELPMRLDLFSHSPDGPNWGYHGSGPAQLSLAILAHALGGKQFGDDLAVTLHQRFKREIVAQLRQESDWSIGRVFVLAWVEHARRGAEGGSDHAVAR